MQHVALILSYFSLFLIFILMAQVLKPCNSYFSSLLLTHACVMEFCHTLVLNFIQLLVLQSLRVNNILTDPYYMQIKYLQKFNNNASIINEIVLNRKKLPQFYANYFTVMHLIQSIVCCVFLFTSSTFQGKQRKCAVMIFDRCSNYDLASLYYPTCDFICCYTC